jgi:hypothetical protein
MSDWVFFADWLKATKKIQTTGYGHDLPMLTDGPGPGDVRAEYFKDNAWATVCELVEMAGEVGWKSWGTDRTLDRERFIGEGVDALHFVGNLLAMVDCTDEELNEAYEKKYFKNWQRLKSGTYDGRVEGKCRGCGRALDDVNTTCTPDYCTERTDA